MGYFCGENLMAVNIIQGDALTVLKTLPDKSVNMCCSSPPYWGLRDYGTATWEGGDVECDHIEIYNSMQSSSSTLGGRLPEKTLDDKRRNLNTIYKEICAKCGAKRIDSQLGLERTPEEYVSKMVEVFKEVKRVLRDDGTLWLNLGDSYATHGGCKGSKHSHNFRPPEVAEREGIYRSKPFGKQIGLKEKDLCGIPWLVAFALRADGWYLRSEIIWHKPNPMPESVIDRPTKSHEQIFLMSKSQRYFYDAAAIAEESQNWGTRDRTNFRGGTDDPKLKHYGLKGSNDENQVRNKRSVWTVTTAPFPGAHFATFPPKLIEPCILAGCPTGGTVLDPFAGSGTTGMVAECNKRNSILIELNPDYIEMAKQRTKNLDEKYYTITKKKIAKIKNERSLELFFE
jgi:DNA modification methylase